MSSLPLYLIQLDQRAHEAINERCAVAHAFKSGVGEDGLKLYIMLTKTLGGHVKWSGENIQVDSSILIKPPYKPENCTPAPNADRNNKTANYVQTLVTRYWNEK